MGLDKLNEASEPLADASEPLNEPSERLTEPSEPLNEPSEPLTEANERLNEPSEPLTEPSERLNEPSGPLTEARKWLKEAEKTGKTIENQSISPKEWLLLREDSIKPFNRSVNYCKKTFASIWLDNSAAGRQLRLCADIVNF